MSDADHMLKVNTIRADRITSLEAEVERLKEHAAEMRRRKIKWTQMATEAEAALAKVTAERDKKGLLIQRLNDALGFIELDETLEIKCDRIKAVVDAVTHWRSVCISEPRLKNVHAANLEAIADAADALTDGEDG